MRTLCASLAIATISLSATSSDAGQLNAAELQKLLAGKTIHLSAPFGSVPIRYSSGGTMSARSKAMIAYAGISEDRGTWRVRGNQVCQRWSKWNKGGEQCFSVSRTGKSINWVSTDGTSGTAYAAN